MGSSHQSKQRSEFCGNRQFGEPGPGTSSFLSLISSHYSESPCFKRQFKENEKYQQNFQLLTLQIRCPLPNAHGLNHKIYKSLAELNKEGLNDYSDLPAVTSFRAFRLGCSGRFIRSRRFEHRQFLKRKCTE